MKDAEARKMRLNFQVFRGLLVTWNQLFRQAADFASEIGRERVVNISHSEDHNNAVVVVWYWQDEKYPTQTAK